MTLRSVIVRLFEFSARCTSAVRDAIDALHQGLWLGLLDDRALDQVTSRWYARQSRFFSEAHNRSGLLDWEAAAVRRHMADARSFLVVGAGGGREALGLSRLGCDVTAAECNPGLLQECRRVLAAERADVPVLGAEPGHLPLTPRTFDAILVGWGAYMHIPGRRSRRALLQECRAALSPGGMLLLSYFTRDAGSRRFSAMYRLATLLRRLRGSRQPVELGDALPNTYDHHFTQEEVRSELEGAGFAVVHLATRPYGHAVARRTE